MLKVHPQNVIPLAKDMGIESPLPEVNSLVLGTGEVFPLEMASGYSNTPLVKKLGIREGFIIAIVDAPGTTRPRWGACRKVSRFWRDSKARSTSSTFSPGKGEVLRLQFPV